MGRQDTTTDVEDELRVAIKARQELGIDHEDEVIESFMSRVQDTIDARVEARVNEALRDVPTGFRVAAPSSGRIAVVLGFITAFLFMAVPLAGVAGGFVALVAIVVCVLFAAATLLLPSGNARAELGPGQDERREKK